MENAASNANGAANGFMGIGMMNMATNGMNMGSSFNNAKPMEPNPSLVNQGNAVGNGQKCSNCGATVTGKFCSECGARVEINKKKFCSNCGNEVTGKFCTNCGTKAE